MEQAARANGKPAFAGSPSVSSTDPADLLTPESEESEEPQPSPQNSNKRRRFHANAGIRKRPHKVKSERQYSRLMKLYCKTNNWSTRFTEKIASSLNLTVSQVYKWSWDRHNMEMAQLQRLSDMDPLPERIWHITRVKRRNIKMTPA